MVLVRGEMETRTRVRASWPPAPTRRDVSHEALVRQEGVVRLDGLSTSAALPPWRAVLALVRVADKPAEGKAYA